MRLIPETARWLLQDLAMFLLGPDIEAKLGLALAGGKQKIRVGFGSRLGLGDGMEARLSFPIEPRRVADFWHPSGCFCLRAGHRGSVLRFDPRLMASNPPGWDFPMLHREFGARWNASLPARKEQGVSFAQEIVGLLRSRLTLD